MDLVPAKPPARRRGRGRGITRQELESWSEAIQNTDQFPEGVAEEDKEYPNAVAARNRALRIRNALDAEGLLSKDRVMSNVYPSTPPKEGELADPNTPHKFALKLKKQ